MVVHPTTVARAGGPYRWEVDIPRGVAGLPGTSVVKCGEVYTFLKLDVDEQIGILPAEYVRRVNQALGVALDLRGAVS